MEYRRAKEHEYSEREEAKPMGQTRKLSEKEKRLKGQGWTRQFVASEPRLSEAVEIYETTGHEVHLEPLTRGDEIDLEGSDGCTTCFDGFEDQYRVIYTRPRKKGGKSENDLW